VSAFERAAAAACTTSSPYEPANCPADSPEVGTESCGWGYPPCFRPDCPGDEGRGTSRGGSADCLTCSQPGSGPDCRTYSSADSPPNCVPDCPPDRGPDGVPGCSADYSGGYPPGGPGGGGGQAGLDGVMVLRFSGLGRISADCGMRQIRLIAAPCSAAPLRVCAPYLSPRTHHSSMHAATRPHDSSNPGPDRGLTHPPANPRILTMTDSGAALTRVGGDCGCYQNA